MLAIRGPLRRWEGPLSPPSADFFFLFSLMYLLFLYVWFFTSRFRCIVSVPCIAAGSPAALSLRA